MNIVERVKNILLSPATEWDKIAVEPTTPKELMITYVLPLAALSAVMQFIKLSVFGVGFFTFGIGIGITMAVFHFVMAFVAVFVIAFHHGCARAQLRRHQGHEPGGEAHGLPFTHRGLAASSESFRGSAGCWRSSSGSMASTSSSGLAPSS